MRRFSPRPACSDLENRLTDSKLRNSTRAILAIAAAALAIAAALFPTHWYELLPRPSYAPPRPFSGAELLRITLAADAMLLGLLAATGWKPRPETAGSNDWQWRNAPRDLSRSQALTLVAAISVIGIVLRVYKVGADLWLDEIATASVYAARPLLEIWGSYASPGNHLLNSLLVRVCTTIFGTNEWSVRIPAVAFGIATIPAMYFAARLAMSRASSVAATALLAVSYHHIFFSQDSRGYSGYLVFVLIGSTLLATLLRRDGLWRWVAYVIVMALSVASLMSAAFAIGAHAIVGAMALIDRKRKGIPASPLAERLILAFGAIGLVAFHIYGVAIPDVLAIYPTIYNEKGSGYFLFSREFLAELVRGISAGFAFGIAAIPVLLGAAAGFIVFARRNWVLAFCLAGTVVVTVAFLVLRGQSIAPRLLLAGLPLAILCLTATVDALIRSPRIALAAGAAIAVASLVALPSYYSAPKQPYREAIRYVERVKTPEQRVIVAYPATGGIEYYVLRDSIKDPASYRYVITRATYDSVVTDPETPGALLMTTLFFVLRSVQPQIAAEIERDWVPLQSFRGTLGGGGITVWKHRPI